MIYSTNATVCRATDSPIMVPSARISRPEGIDRLVPTQRITWITGWGIPLDWLRPSAEALLPDAVHLFLPPTRQAAQDAASADCVVGWSLGALRLIEAFSEGVVFGGRVVLLAPFLAFCAEHNLGGRCSLAQVKWLRRWVERDTPAALTDFYHRANLSGVEAAKAPGKPELLEGLDRLAMDATPVMRRWASGGTNENMSVFVGADDSLLDAAQVARTIPNCRIVPGAGHSAVELVRAHLEVFRAV